MTTYENKAGPTSSGIPAIILVVVLGLASAGFLGLFGSIGEGLGGNFSSLTIAKMSIAGACLGASVAGLAALFCGLHLRRGFSCLSFAAFSTILGLVVSESSTHDNPYQTLKDAIALGTIFASLLVGAFIGRFVTRFGPKSRAWGGMSAVIGLAVAFPLTAVLYYASMKGERAQVQAQYPDLDLSSFSILPDALISALIWALSVALVGGWLGAIVGAIRDSVLVPIGITKEHNP